MTYFQPLTVSAPSRLHFGMFGVGELIERNFGGMGLMIDHPRTVLQFKPAEHLEVSSSHADLILELTETWFEAAAIPKSTFASHHELPVHITTARLPDRHVGLGSGTQLALSLAAGLSSCFQCHSGGTREASAAMQRGKRSAIGSYGFQQGGFLVDRGVAKNEILAPLDLRIDFPDKWPIVLVISSRKTGLFGSRELDAFRKLPDVTPDKRDQMIELARTKIIPGILANDYDLFAPSLYEFGKQCGEFFSELQGGPFNGRLATGIVQVIRDFGIPAVGQSSWGPSIFAIARHEQQARELEHHLRKTFDRRSSDCPIETIVTRADNKGARIATDCRSKIESV